MDSQFTIDGFDVFNYVFWQNNLRAKTFHLKPHQAFSLFAKLNTH